MRMNRKNLLITIVVSLSVYMLGGGHVRAGNVSIPNTFVSGDPAVAADVNANFNAVEAAVDDNDSRITDLESSGGAALTAYNRSDYSGSLSQSIFEVTINGAATSCDRFIFDNTPSAVAGGTEISRLLTISRSSDSSICYQATLVFFASAADSSFYLESFTEPDAYSGGDGEHTETPNTPSGRLLFYPGTMYPGVTFGDGATMTRHYPSYQGGGSLDEERIFSRTAVVVGVEDVTTAAGSFSGCLKVAADRAGNAKLGQLRGVMWLCPGVGLARWLRIYNSGEVRKYELISYTPN